MITGRLVVGFWTSLVAGILIAAGGAAAQPCTGQQVVPGDSTEEVAARCGAAMLKEHREVSVTSVGQAESRRTVTVIDDWTYDAGPQELMQTLHFENGKLAGLAVVGYGRLRDSAVDNCRNGELLAVGDTQTIAYLKCGEPLAKERLPEKKVETVEEGARILTTLTVEEWTYRYGPDAPGYTLRFENGVVADIRPRAFGK